MTEFVRTLLLVLAAYLAAGLLFAFAFQLRGLRAIDTAAHGTGIAFRLLITPGVVALWPLVAMRWRHAITGGSFLGGHDTPVSPRRLRSTHALAWKALMVLVPIIVAAALWYRPKGGQSSLLKVPIPGHRGLPGSQSPH